MIIIISDKKDIHARCVSKELEKVGKSSTIMNMDSFAQGSFLTHSVGNYAKIQTQDIKSINRDEIEAVWFRRPRSIQMPTIFDNNDRAFTEGEWADSYLGFLLSIKARFVNPIISQAIAVKPHQLEAARKVGLNIPDTCITNDPEVAQDFIKSKNKKIVHKALHAANHHFVDTKRWSDGDLKFMEYLPLCPTIFQEEIYGVKDIRITVVGEEMFAAAIETPKNIVDSRLVPHNRYSCHHLDKDIQNDIIRLMQELNLSFGTIDLKLLDNEKYVFFEINPQGQFLYIEVLTGLPITRSVAKFLSS